MRITEDSVLWLCGVEDEGGHRRRNSAVVEAGKSLNAGSSFAVADWDSIAPCARLDHRARPLWIALSESRQPRHRVVQAALLLGTLTAAGRVSHWEMPSISVDSFLLLFGQALIVGQGAR